MKARTMVIATMITNTMAAMAAPTITGVWSAAAVVRTWRGGATEVEFSMSINEDTPFIAVTETVYSTPGFRPAKNKGCVPRRNKCPQQSCTHTLMHTLQYIPCSDTTCSDTTCNLPVMVPVVLATTMHSCIIPSASAS